MRSDDLPPRTFPNEEYDALRRECDALKDIVEEKKFVISVLDATLISHGVNFDYHRLAEDYRKIKKPSSD